jgi:predicted RNA polymerase sigma factor
MAQRISRAKKTIRTAGSRFVLPGPVEWPARLAAVLHVLYLVFNEGYTASSGDQLQRTDLSSEAIRLTRMAHRLLPEDGEVTGLLALMLLTDARTPARTSADGSLVPLAEQDRTRWRRTQIEEGVGLLTGALASRPLGPYQLQAAIAAVHDEAPSADSTDWPEILALYELLHRLQPGPVVALNHAVATAMVHGPAAGLQAVDALQDTLRDQHRFHAVRAHLLQLAGQTEAARAAYGEAVHLSTSTPERRYLRQRLADLEAVD